MDLSLSQFLLQQIESLSMVYTCVLRHILVVVCVLPLVLLLSSPAAAKTDAQKIMQANIKRPGIIPSEIVRLAQTDPDSVSFCRFEQGRLVPPETCGQVLVEPDIIPPAQFPQPLPCNVNAVFAAGVSKATGSIGAQESSQQENTLLLLTQIVNSRTNDRIAREQGILSLVYRGLSGPIKLYSNGGSISRVDPLLCGNYINRELPPSIGEPPAYESYLFEDKDGHLRAEVDLFNDPEMVKMGSPEAGCLDVAENRFAGLLYIAVEFSEEALIDLTTTTMLAHTPTPPRS